MSLCEPEWVNPVDASRYIAFRDSMRLVEFLTAIRDEFENTRASLRHPWKVLLVNSFKKKPDSLL